MVWIAFALMTAAAVLCAVWPLIRPRRETGIATAELQASTDISFYRQQLLELDADVHRGLLAGADADGVRAELGRRLIAASERTSAATPRSGVRHRVAAGIVAGVVSITAIALYAKVGHPNEPDEPLSARAAGRDDFASAMAKMEAHLDMNPDDGRGSELIAPIYLKTGRFDAAARALRNAIRVLGPTPTREAALGQALVMEADGVVTGEARHVFDAALKGDPAMPQARFFEGLAALQDGDKGTARSIWTALVDEAPPEAPYTGILRQRLAALDGMILPEPAMAAQPGALPQPGMGPPAGPGLQGGAAPLGAAPTPMGAMPAGAAAVAALPPEQRQLAIRGMVDGLAARLAQNGQDPEGWLRLVRAYKVLGETDKAQQALADARRSMGGDAQQRARLDQLARELGLEG